MIFVISCSFFTSFICYYFYVSNNKKKKNIKLDKELPQKNGCNHKKDSNTYFYEDKIYCEYCWNNIIIYNL